MIPVRQYQNKRVAVFGLGRSGLAAARALRDGGARVIAWDDNEARRKAAAEDGVALEDLYASEFEGVKALVLSPGVPLTHPEPHPVVRSAREAEVPIIGDIELFQAAVRAAPSRPPIIGVTGTNGKSTTTALIGHLLQVAGRNAQVGGNIGRPVLELSPPNGRTVYVIEISSFQIDLTPSLAPDVAILLNITPDHLDRHGSLEAYVEVKSRIFARQDRGDTAILGIDDAKTRTLCTRTCGRRAATVVPISVGKTPGRGVYVIDGVLYESSPRSQTQRVCDLSPIETLRGAHNWQNAAAAFAAARAVGLTVDEIAEGLRTFPGLPHRMEPVGEIEGVRFINDSKATNADAAAKALGSFEHLHWIAGGRPKAGGIDSLDTYFDRINHAYLIGEAAEEFAATLEGKVPYTIVETLDRAVPAAHMAAAEDEGATVLFSPACASFDQFPDFEARGDAFKAEVRALRGETAQGGAAA